jgi:predicted secreted protein
MAKRVVTSTRLTLATVAYDAQVEEASLEMESDAQDVTNMASGGWKEFLGGLKSWKLTVSFKKDADMSGLDAAMFAAFGTVIAMTLKGTSDAISTANADFQGSILVSKWTPIAGKVGEVFGGSYTWEGTGALTRDVTP